LMWRRTRRGHGRKGLLAEPVIARPLLLWPLQTAVYMMTG
jgi:hypothetical protein